MTDTPQKRGGITQRLRTQEKLTAAAREVFSTKGWAEVRMIDIANAAGVSEQTVYNHSKTKHWFAQAAFSQLVAPLLEVAGNDLDDGLKTPLVVERFIHSLARLAHDNYTLTANLLAATGEQLSSGRAATITGTLTMPIATLLTYALNPGRQQLGSIDESLHDLLSYNVLGLLVRTVVWPTSDAETNARIVLGQLIPVMLARFNADL